MKALVTGAAGFIGTNLVDRLVSLGHEVVGIDRHNLTDAPCSHLVTDLAEPSAAPLLDRWARWADVVFHLAARAGIRDEGRTIAMLRERDILMATSRVLEATPRGTHLVVASSSSVYGGATRIDGVARPSLETDTLRPRGGYSAAKAEVETMCKRRVLEGGEVAIVRPFTVAGERQRDDMALSLWLDALAQGEPVTVFGSPDRARDVTDVSKVVEGLVAIADVRFLGVVNLGAGRPRTLREMIAAAERAVGRHARIEIQPAIAHEAETTFADVTKCRAELGVDLVTDLDDVVARQFQQRLEAAKQQRTA